MPPPIFILSAVVLIVIIIIARSARRKKNVYRNIVRKDRNITPEEKVTFSSDRTSTLKTSNTSVCKTCKGTKKVKCKFCHGFGSTKTTRVGPSTTTSVPKTRAVFDAKGKVSYQHYFETQVKPGKTQFVNQPCGSCGGSGKVKCPNC